eukprot:4917557-Ditylum_brightwellii.AAC.1
METCVCYEEYKPKETKKSSTTCESHSEREEGSAKPSTKLAKRLTVTGGEILHNVIPMAKDVTIESIM